MPYLIDGHNVIAQMNAIELDDPHDEAKFVILLRQYTASISKKAHVVFDGGVPGGSSPLSTSRVQVYFASAQSSADNVLRMMIRDTKNPSGWIVVSSDRAIVDVARRRGMRVVRAERFAQRLEKLIANKIQEENEAFVPPTKSDPHLSSEEVDEWLDLFSDNDS